MNSKYSHFGSILQKTDVLMNNVMWIQRFKDNLYNRRNVAMDPTDPTVQLQSLL